REPLPRSQRRAASLRRRGPGAGAAVTARQPDLVVPVPRHHQGPARLVPLRLAGLPGLRPLAAWAGIWVHAGRARPGGRAVHAAAGSPRRDHDDSGLGRSHRICCSRRNPDRFAAFVIGNTWAWPKSDPGTQFFSRLMGGPVGGYLILRRNVFVEQIIPRNVRRKQLPDAVMAAYRGPFPTPESRHPIHVFPREILASRPFL